MSITHMHSYLVHPGKGVDAKDLQVVRGTTLDLSGQLYSLLAKVYGRSATDCKTSVSFKSDNQSNAARDLIVSYADRPRLDTGRKLAKRLQSVTDGTPGLGLLFLIRGEEAGKTKTLISRFPADVGILADETQGKLTVEYLEKVFMRNSNKYKAAAFEDASPRSGYWKGRVVDHQIQYGVVRTVSDYWVIDFLESDCLTTPALGSQRLAKMIDKAIKASPDTSVKHELASAAKLIPNLSGKKISADLVSKQYNLSNEAKAAIKAEASSDEIFNEEFVLDSDSFAEVLSFESIELNTGAILTAPAGEFDEVFQEELLDQQTGLRIYQAEGVVADQRFRKAKP